VGRMFPRRETDRQSVFLVRSWRQAPDRRTLTRRHAPGIPDDRLPRILRICMAVLVLLTSTGVRSLVTASAAPDGCEDAALLASPSVSEPEHGEDGCSDCSPGCADCLCCSARAATAVLALAVTGPTLAEEPLVVRDPDVALTAVVGDIFHPPKA
jgi:hypothetical protein